MPSRPFHPLLLAAFPVLFLYTRNLDIVPVHELFKPMVVVLVLAAAVYLILHRILRNAARAALVSSVATLFFFSYGHIHDAVEEKAIGGFIWGRHLVLLPTLIAVGAIAMVLAARVRTPPVEVTKLLNGFSVILVGLALVPLIGHRADVKLPASTVPAVKDPPIKLHPTAAVGRPDIYYIVLEDYGGQDTLRSWGYDVAAFYGLLRKRGFYVAHSWANYPRTTHSLGSTLNMQYMNRIDPLYETSSSDWISLFKLLNGAAVPRALQSIGYRYVHLGSWWEQTKIDPTADVNIRPRALSQFARALLESTMAAVPIDKLPFYSLETNHQLWQVTRKQFRDLERSSSRPGPKFVFAHMMVPHGPFVFRRDGTYRPHNEAVANPVANFIDQVAWVSKRVAQTIAKIQSSPRGRDAIIVLQTDEGPYPPGYSEADANRWDRANLSQLGVKLEILNTYYAPKRYGLPFYPNITPVNSFRLIFAGLFGAKLPLLPDQIWVYRNSTHPHFYTNITNKAPLYRHPPPVRASAEAPPPTG